MGKSLAIPLDLIVPSAREILQAQGIPPGKADDIKICELLDQAIALFKQNALPGGIVMPISKEDFSTVFGGEGKNADDAPLDKIYKSADSLTLFAVTLGGKISNEILALFDKQEFAVAAMLDSTASEGAEKSAAFLENTHRQFLIDAGKFRDHSTTLRFSPGYCGWDISGQKKLFEYLEPDEIGISLRESFLMIPLKSISGVIVAGKNDIFDFDDNLSFCEACQTHSCRNRRKVE